MGYPTGRFTGYCMACLTNHTGSCEKYLQRIKNHLRTRQAVAAGNAPKVISSKVLSPEYVKPEVALKDVRIIPPALQNIDVRVSEDGVWLGFKAKSGKQCAIHVGNIINGERVPGNTVITLEDWMQDMKDSSHATKT